MRQKESGRSEENRGNKNRWEEENREIKKVVEAKDVQEGWIVSIRK